ncbi:hypothetical protein CCACVL1_12698 [Corchorus capsularis]|uniref:Bifunctional inhibitor/plant lipid transfer protein/seed storage helical domain-containing protein n=1 Tax=Corchorus capsularis TaxID=210143 RepID=A0A1R3IEE2_COCAP|nr:hypothetical protein CCACVL1_12698 [Corchorus capsularis]
MATPKNFFKLVCVIVAVVATMVVIMVPRASAAAGPDTDYMDQAEYVFCKNLKKQLFPCIDQFLRGLYDYKPTELCCKKIAKVRWLERENLSKGYRLCKCLMPKYTSKSLDGWLPTIPAKCNINYNITFSTSPDCVVAQ